MVGSKKPDLQAEALAIIAVSLSHHVHIELEWILRKNNETADYLSCIIDYDDWSSQIDVQWGPHTIDRFTSYYNTQLPL